MDSETGDELCLISSNTTPSERESDETSSDSSLSEPEPRGADPQPYNYADCMAAMRGERLPEDLSSAVARAAVVRGIRLHYSFAMSPAVVELTQPEFVRACNARRIMSNDIPDALDDDPLLLPYCIWHPDYASEETYRQLYRRYPVMRYQVGRACAAAGFSELYAELDLLPDVSIAEEARESTAEGSRIIYETVMAAPQRFAVMDDHTRSVDLETPKQAFLNGRTHVRLMLECRSHFFPPGTVVDGPLAYDIEEDRYLGPEYYSPEGHSAKYYNLQPEVVELLYNPLPPDLPTLNTQLLLQMAAYDGNVDRYARLSLPDFPMDHIESLCVLRGIYHHTMFAKWWSLEVERNPARLGTAGHLVKSAILARRIMTNDILGIDANTENLPELIWWPLKPDRLTLDTLLERCPQMKKWIAIACIFCDYEDDYRALEIKPDHHLWQAAHKSGNLFYREDLKKRAEELQMHETSYVWGNILDHRENMIGLHLEPTVMYLPSPINANHMGDYDDRKYNGIFAGEHALCGPIDRHVWASPELRLKAEAYNGWFDGDLDWLVAADMEEIREVNAPKIGPAFDW